MKWQNNSLKTGKCKYSMFLREKKGLKNEYNQGCFILM